MKKVLVGLFLAAIFIVGCASIPSSNPKYQEISLNDLRSNIDFTLSQFSHKPILLQAFSLANPESTWQQHEFKKLQNRVGDEVVLISLDVDPKDSVNQVKEHFNSIGFDWRYAYASEKMRQALIDEFNVSIINAPKVPVVLICPNQEGYLLQDGLKESWQLAELIEGC